MDFRFLLDRSPRQIAHILHRLFAGEILSKEINDLPCIFTLSTGRVGTQTLSALLDLSKGLLALHEPKPLLYGLSKLAYESCDPSGYTFREDVGKILRESFLSLREEKIRYAATCSKTYVETSPQNTFLAPVIAQTLPNAKFIHLVREPSSVVRSGMRRGWFAGHPYDVRRVTPRGSDKEHALWDSASSFTKNVWLWTETNRWIQDFVSTLAPDRTIRIRSEDLFAANQKEVEKLFEFTGQGNPSPEKISRVLGKPLNAQLTGEFPLPEDWTPKMREEILAIADQTMAELGY